MRYETEKLIKIYGQFGKIVIGVDFDDTIFPLTDAKYVIDRCAEVRGLLNLVKDSATLCLYTVAEEWSVKYKVTIMRDLYKLPVDYVNASPLSTTPKPFFNILLDDKAGLNETIEILKEFINYYNED